MKNTMEDYTAVFVAILVGLPMESKSQTQEDDRRRAAQPTGQAKRNPQQQMKSKMQDYPEQCISTITQNAPRHEHIPMQYEPACAQEDNLIAL